jgi:hypothetical protein
MSGNPFEPPKTTELDSVGDPAVGGTTGSGLTLSGEALQELIVAAPLVRWLSRLISLSIAVGLFHAIADLVRSGSAVSRAARLLTTALGTGIWTVVLMALRRYSAASNRLRPGEPAARGHVIGTQASYVRLLGVLAIIGLALLVLVAAIGLPLLAGYVAGRQAVGR